MKSRLSRSCVFDTHRNIVKVLFHGQLDLSTRYYIDMEWCDLNLDHYIQGNWTKEIKLSAPFFIESPTCEQWIFAISLITQHILRGLVFIHGQREVHRDLKPNNGRYRELLSLTLVFFCSADGNWKIGDFGFVRAGSSVVAKQSLFGHGTAGYRAFELLREIDGNFTNKVDIFALGCIIFEMVTKKQAFCGDWDVREYALSQPPTPLNVEFAVPVDEAFRSLFVTIIHETLRSDPSSRPSARGLLREIVNPLVQHLESAAIRKGISIHPFSLLASSFNCPVGDVSWRAFARVSREDSRALAATC